MIRAALAIVLVGILSLSVSAQPNAAARKVAVLVGVNNYDGTGLGSLSHSVRDMEALRERLAKAGFEVELLPNATATKLNIESALAKIKANRKVGDLTLVALSGHGVQMPNAEGQEDAFFCPAGCEKREIDSLMSLTKLVDSLGGKGVNLVLVDACRDDPRKGFRGIQGNELQGRLPANTAVFFSCSAGQQSYETNRMFPNDPSLGHGVFFFHVLKGLDGAAKDSDGEVTWDTLVSYVKKNVDVKVKEWFDDRASQLARDRGVGVPSLAMQTPHQLANLQQTPVLAKIAPEPVAVVNDAPPKVERKVGTDVKMSDLADFRKLLPDSVAKSRWTGDILSFDLWSAVTLSIERTRTTWSGTLTYNDHLTEKDITKSVSGQIMGNKIVAKVDIGPTETQLWEAEINDLNGTMEGTVTFSRLGTKTAFKFTRIPD